MRRIRHMRRNRDIWCIYDVRDMRRIRDVRRIRDMRCIRDMSVFVTCMLIRDMHAHS